MWICLCESHWTTAHGAAVGDDKRGRAQGSRGAMQGQTGTKRGQTGAKRNERRESE